ncbi:MAG TPA: 50S ribosomal protein L18 [Candidatus Pacebacteria bacterium]|nr:50S ribosomal protein L18 [Candidatus Paceibacterota bacterium]HIP33430.1 50S ribosomal protein L18 [Bacteroidia bacterium]
MDLKTEKRIRRHRKIRSTLSGTAETPRIVVSKSNKDLFVQVIDDVTEKTLFSISTIALKGTKTEQAKEAGKKLGEEVKKSGIEKIVFDRGGYLYTGRIKELADSLRESGLKF